MPLFWTRHTPIGSAKEKWLTVWLESKGNWQINHDADTKAYLLIDAAMPWDVPASAVMGTFGTLEEAKAHAEKTEPTDWSTWFIQ